MALQVAALSIQLIETLRPLVPRIKQRDKSVADQLTRAASSAALNIGEAELSDPGKRRSRFHTAAGSANETLKALRVAVASSAMRSKPTRPVHDAGNSDLRTTLR
jgi:four helix bundle protein